MNFLQKKIWTAWSKFRFLRLPVERRVRLEVTTDGRHITFILVSLYEAGYGVQVVGSPAVFRELICLKKTAPIPFVIGGKERSCGISITDKSGFNHRGHREHGGRKRVLLDYDFFSGLMERVEPHPDGWAAARETAARQPEGPDERDRATQITRIEAEQAEQAGRRLAGQDGADFSNPFTSELAQDAENTSPTRTANDPTAPGEYSSSMLIREIRGQNASLPATSHSPLVTALRAPYFMHQTAYHRGLHKSPLAGKAFDPRSSTFDSFARRRFRIGFFGTHDREFYSKHYHFPGMNRFEILEAFFENFGDTFVNLEGAPREWNAAQIAVAIDSQGGDRKGKTFLSQDHYFAALRECDFVLSPPGWCMPLSHNLIEAMFCGAIPITNAKNYMVPELSQGENCLNFQDAEGLVAVIERALAMDTGEVLRKRQAVREFYQRYLEPKSFAESVIHSKAGKILLNAEEKSVLRVFPGRF
jgi:hypothetical protein